MHTHPTLARSGAGVLIALAIAAIVQATTLNDVHQSGAKPFFRGIARQGPVTATRPPVEPAEPPAPTAVVPPGRSSVRVPILMYHYIRVNPDPGDRLGFNLSVTPADFAHQMEWLAEHAYHPVDFDDLRSYLLGNQSLPARPVILTFDDGYRDMYTTAFPILRAHQFKGVSYVVSGFLNSPRYITVEMLLEMDAGGIQIGAHTVSHADLTKISAGSLHHEVFDSKADLESLLGHPVVDFCYPSGKFSDAVVRVVQGAGFESATTTEPGVSHSARDRFVWTRVRVNGGESLEQFATDLSQTEPTVVLTPTRQAPGRGLQRKVTFPLQPPQAAPEEAPPIEGPAP